MDREFGERLQRLSRMGDVDLLYILRNDHWVCRLVVCGVEAIGTSFSPEAAVDLALEKMREAQRARQTAREVSCNIRAYLYNPQRLTR